MLTHRKKAILAIIFSFFSKKAFAAQTYSFQCTAIVDFTPEQKWKYVLDGFATQPRDNSPALVDADGLRLHASTLNWTLIQTKKGQEWNWQEQLVMKGGKLDVLFFGRSRAEFSLAKSKYGMFLYLRLPGHPDTWSAIPSNTEETKSYYGGHLAMEHYLDEDSFIVSSDLYNRKKIPNCVLTPVYPH